MGGSIEGYRHIADLLDVGRVELGFGGHVAESTDGPVSKWRADRGVGSVADLGVGTACQAGKGGDSFEQVVDEGLGESQPRQLELGIVDLRAFLASF